MKKSIKAALLSAFVFPGVGHFILKKHAQGMVIALATGYGLFVITSNLIDKAQKITDKILNGEIAIDVAAISAELTKQSNMADAQQINTATAVIIIAWVIGVLDSYRLGLKEDKNSKQNQENQENKN